MTPGSFATEAEDQPVASFIAVPRNMADASWRLIHLMKSQSNPQSPAPQVQTHRPVAALDGLGMFG